MKDIVPYWYIDNGRAPFTITYQVEPKRAIKNPNFNIPQTYLSSAYLSKFQISKKALNVTGGPLLTKQDGGRAIFLAEEDSTVRLGDGEFQFNIKGAGTYSAVVDNPFFSEKEGTFYAYYTYEKQHCHLLEAPKTLDFTGFTSFKRKNRGVGARMASLITDDDFDRNKSGPHRPYGGQNLDLAFTALRNSDAVKSEKFKIRICPVAAIVELPEKSVLETFCLDGLLAIAKNGQIYIEKIKRQNHEFKAFENASCMKKIQKVAYGQEIRLLPSNVRVEAGGEDIFTFALRDNSPKIASSLKENGVSLGDFRDNLISTGLETCLLPYRAAKPTKDGKYTTYVFSQADPVRDSPIDMSGRMHFADLESLGELETSPLWILLSHTKEGIWSFIDTAWETARLEIGAGQKTRTELMEFMKRNYGSTIERLLPEGINLRVLPNDEKIMAVAKLGEDEAHFEYDCKTGFHRTII